MTRGAASCYMRSPVEAPEGDICLESVVFLIKLNIFDVVWVVRKMRHPQFGVNLFRRRLHRLLFDTSGRLLGSRHPLPAQPDVLNEITIKTYLSCRAGRQRRRAEKAVCTWLSRGFWSSLHLTAAEKVYSIQAFTFQTIVADISGL